MLPDIKEKDLDKDMLETYHSAITGNFLIPDDFDELQDYSVKRNVQKYNMDSLGLTIAPTLSCNFKCIYCYETSKRGVISEKTQNNIINFVASQVNRLKNLDVTWYGGEPLLAVDAISNMSQKLQTLCADNGIHYSAFMISNGSLIDDAIIQMMKQCNIHGVQITIDGPKRVHDSRRICKNGNSSFDKIISNINLLLSNDIEVVLRINVDKSNEDTLEDLIDYLEHNLVSSSVKISFGQVTAYTEACRSIENSCYNNGEFAQKLAKYYRILKTHGFQKMNPFPYPTARLNYCCAELLNSFVIDHEGYLYKCWNEVGNVSSAIGNINEVHLDIANYKNGQWITNDPTKHSVCKKCNLLPLCVGGCPHSTIVQKKPCNCDLIKYNIEDVMLTYYNYTKEGLL